MDAQVSINAIADHIAIEKLGSVTAVLQDSQTNALDIALQAVGCPSHMRWKGESTVVLINAKYHTAYTTY